MASKFIHAIFFLVLASSPALPQKIFFSGNDDNSIFICEDGTVLMSGENSEGQLGNGSYVPTNSPKVLAGLDNSGKPLKCKQAQIEGVSAFLALTNSGDTVISWGINNHGQVGDGTTNEKTFPVRVKGVGGNGYLENIKQIATGNFTSYALTEDGYVLSWGYNFYGQVGNGTYTSPVLFPNYVLKGPGDTLKNVKSISAGGVTCMAVLCDGTLWLWGRNNLGQLAQTTNDNSEYAIQAMNSSGTGFLTNIVKIEAGDNYCFALSASDTLWSWGANSSGQLGNGLAYSRQGLPVIVRDSNGTAPLYGVQDIGAGQGHSVALLNDQTIVAWGRNDSGQLGNNDTINLHLPNKVSDPSGNNFLNNINYIGTGDHFTIVRSNTNQLYIWGENTLGELELGDHVNRKKPVELHLSSPPATDKFPYTGKINFTSHVCIVENQSEIFLSKHYNSVFEWQKSYNNFSEFTSIDNKNFSITAASLTKPTYFRAVLKECSNQYFSPVALIKTDSATVPGQVRESATVRYQINKGLLKIADSRGDILRWESSTDHFIKEIDHINNYSNELQYAGLTKNTSYRTLVKNGVCPEAYSEIAEITLINENQIVIYNSFTPNGDHYNDEWVIDLIEHFPNNKVEIYNRWGQPVFKAEAYDNAKVVWNGENNLNGNPGIPLEDGTYFYLVDIGEEKEILKGFVVISR